MKRRKGQAVLEALRRREPLFHRSEFGRSRAELERLIVKDFWEIGASGRRYSRRYVLDTLAASELQPIDDDWKAGNFRCRKLAPGLYLLTYTLLQGTRKTRRATIWQRKDRSWKAVFHQGTIVQE
ncbi:MAG TPA: DUF4440 domain-containing protein [Steroidobacteraceae bacterium]|nr:DUF4440 domain-containing protein [Steroidobacteraceae bacterium]